MSNDPAYVADTSICVRVHPLPVEKLVAEALRRGIEYGRTRTQYLPSDDEFISDWTKNILRLTEPCDASCEDHHEVWTTTTDPAPLLTALKATKNRISLGVMQDSEERWRVFQVICSALESAPAFDVARLCPEARATLDAALERCYEEAVDLRREPM